MERKIIMKNGKNVFKKSITHFLIKTPEKRMKGNWGNDLRERTGITNNRKEGRE